MKKILLRTSSIDENHEKLEKSLSKNNHLDDNENSSKRYTIHFGTSQVKTTLHLNHNELNDTIQMNSSIANKVHLPEGQTFNAYVYKSHLWIGPLIGIFTVGFTSANQLPLGKRSQLIAKYIRTSQKIGAYSFVFGPHQINWNDGLIHGFTFDKSHRWQKIILPFPNVIYDRTPNRKAESHTAIRVLKEKLDSQYQIPRFNSLFFHKWDIHQHLMTHPYWRKLLPDSILSPNDNELHTFIHKHRNVFLKPVDGSLGRGIQAVFYCEKSQSYECRINELNQHRTFNSLTKLIKHQFPQGLNNYLVQKAIRLISLKKLPIDFRVHTNKNSQGVWTVTAFAAKVAGDGNVTTHLHNGGKIVTISELIRDLQLSAKPFNKIKYTAIGLSRAIDEMNQFHIGEIGFDFAIDSNLDIWMLEANSRPGRGIFSHSLLQKQAQNTLTKPIEYSQYLFKKMIASDSFNA